MAQQLYILDPDNQAIPVSWGEFDVWEEKLPKAERSALGKLLRIDTVGSVTVLTVFLATPIGYYGRKPQLWLTIAAGRDVYEERRYSSHRAAISGHLASLRDHRPKVSEI